MKENEELTSYILSRLAANGADVRWNYSKEDFRFDLYIKDPQINRRYLVEVKHRATLETIAYLNLMQEYFHRRGNDSNCVTVLATRSISPRLRDLAADFGIRVVDLPIGMGFDVESRGGVAAVKISAPKTWNLVAALIKRGSSSIRALAISEGVSYAWAHRVIQSLIEQGAVKNDGNRVEVIDVRRILNGIAWERPLTGLVRKEIDVADISVLSLARELTATMRENRRNIAFCGYLAGTLHTGAVMRHDLVQAYVPKEWQDDVLDLLGRERGGGIRLQLLEPDRDVFTSGVMVEEVSVTSPRQTLLDAAGMGYGGMEIADALVRMNDRL
jgi:hypothetical protein